jgi:hypothetical protein
MEFEEVILLAVLCSVAAHCFFNTNYTADEVQVVLHADLLDPLYLSNAKDGVALG